MDILIKGMDEIPEDGAVLVVKHDNGKAYIKHACMYGYSMELVKLPAAQPDHVADIGKKVEGDCISRQAAIEALARMMPRSYTPDGSHPADEEIFRAQEVFADCIEALEILPSAQPEIIRCKDCKHRHVENMVWTCPFGLPGGENFFCGYGTEPYRGGEE